MNTKHRHFQKLGQFVASQPTFKNMTKESSPNRKRITGDGLKFQKGRIEQVKIGGKEN